MRSPCRPVALWVSIPERHVLWWLLCGTLPLALSKLRGFHLDVPLDDLSISDTFLIHPLLGVLVNLAKSLLEQAVAETLHADSLIELRCNEYEQDVDEDHLIAPKKEGNDQGEVQVHEVDPLDLILLPVLRADVLYVSLI